MKQQRCNKHAITLQHHEHDPERFLTDLAKQYEQKSDESWDNNKRLSIATADTFFMSGRVKTAVKVLDCVNRMECVRIQRTDGKLGFKIVRCWFCKNRFCPLCMKRFSVIWSGRVMRGMEQLLAARSDVAFVMLTFTLRNPEMGELRSTISDMNAAWRRMSRLKSFPLLGWIKCLEVKRAKDGKAHPHFHVLGVVPKSYFTGARYVSTQKWAESWGKALEVDYTPVCDARKVKFKPGQEVDQLDSLHSAVREVIKYTTKPEDYIGEGTDLAWFSEAVNQLHGVRRIAVGGILREYLRDEDPMDGDLLDQDISDEDYEELNTFSASWEHSLRRYVIQ